MALPTPTTYEPFLDDYVVYWVAGRFVLNGDADKLYDLDAINSAEAAAVGEPASEVLVLPYYNPPFVAGLFAPLALLPLKASAIVFTLLMLVVLGITLRLILNRLNNPLEACLWTGGVLSSLPFFYAVGHGQFSFFLLFTFTASYLMLKRGSDGWAGAILSLLLMKPQLLLLPLLLLVFKRRTTALQGFALGSVALGSLSLLIAGPSFLSSYPQLLLNATTWDDQAGILTWAMYGWNGFFRGILGSDDYHLVALLHVGASVATTWLCLSVWRDEWQPGSPDFDVRFSLIVLGVLLTSPHLYGQDLIIGVLPAILLYSRWEEARHRLPVAAFALTGWLLLYFHFLLLASTSLNLVTLLMFVAALGCYLVLVRGARRPSRKHAEATHRSLAMEAVADVS